MVEGIRLESESDLARLLQVHRYAQVGHCVNGVTHDINNLLGAAMAYAELASFDPSVSPDTARMLAQIVEGATKCSELVKSLTSIARRDRADINLVSLDKLLDEVLLLLDYEFKMAQITFERRIAAGLEPIPVDLPRLKTALLYLLLNAQRAVRDKDRRIVRVTIVNTGDGACIEVWDSGGGLAPEFAERAFEPLTSFWGEGDHLGMGLYMARRVAEMHDGHLRYEDGRGFCLTIQRRHDLNELL